jgi:stage V sporulation protein B
VVRGGALLMLAKLVHIAASFPLWFFLSALLDRSLGAGGVAAFGVYGTTMLVVNPLNMMFGQGALQMVSRTVASREDDPDGAFRACLTVLVPLLVLFTVAFQFAAPWIARAWLNDPAYVTPLRVGGCIPALYGLRAAYQGWCNGTRAYRQQAWVDMGSSILRMALVLGGAALGHGALGALGGFLGAALLMVLVTAAWLRPGPAREDAPAGDTPLRLLTLQGAVLLVTLGIFLLTTLDQVAIKAAGASDPAVTDRLAGYFTGCQKIAQIPWALVLGVVWALFPLVAGAHDVAERRRVLRSGFRVLLLLLLPVAALLSSTSDASYALLFASKVRLAAEQFGDPLSVVSEPLAVLAPAYVANGLLVASAMLLVASGRAFAALLVMAVTLTVTRLATLELVASQGPLGAALGTGLGSVVGLVLALGLLAWGTGAIVPLLSLARIGAAAAVVWCLGRVLPGEGLLLLAKDGALVLAGTAVLLLTRELTFAELKDLRASLRPR